MIEFQRNIEGVFKLLEIIKTPIKFSSNQGHFLLQGV